MRVDSSAARALAVFLVKRLALFKVWFHLFFFAFSVFSVLGVDFGLATWGYVRNTPLMFFIAGLAVLEPRQDLISILGVWSIYLVFAVVRF